MEKNITQIYQRRFVINDHDRYLTYLNIYELSDNALIRRLELYCEVLKSLPFLNGNRHYRIAIHEAIPSYLRFGKFLVRLLHDGQEDTCRCCNR